MQKLCYSDAGIALTKRYEGLRLKAYQDSGGVWTIGYGHTGNDVHPEKEVTQLEAESLLRADLGSALDCVNEAVKAPLQQNQFDALVDFCFNVGSGNFVRSTLLLKVNEKDFEMATEQFGIWINVNGQPSRGLQTERERSAESAMFRGSYRGEQHRLARCNPRLVLRITQGDAALKDKPPGWAACP